MLPFTCFVFVGLPCLRTSNDLITSENDGKGEQTPSSNGGSCRGFPPSYAGDLFIYRGLDIRGKSTFGELWLLWLLWLQTRIAQLGSCRKSEPRVSLMFCTRIVSSVRILHRQEWLRWRSRAALFTAAAAAVASERKKRYFACFYVFMASAYPARLNVNHSN